MENNTQVVFNTIIGNVPVDARLEFNVSKEFLNGETDKLRDNITAKVSIDKSNPYAWSDGHKKYNIDFSLAVCYDIRELIKHNAEYAAKEDNGRHHVDLNTLSIRKIWIDGKHLSIEWRFEDCYGDGRCFMGNTHVIHDQSDDRNHENFYCSSPLKMQIYF